MKSSISRSADASNVEEPASINFDGVMHVEPHLFPYAVKM
jgi:hypothetical protein